MLRFSPHARSPHVVAFLSYFILFIIETVHFLEEHMTTHDKRPLPWAVPDSTRACKESKGRRGEQGRRRGQAGTARRAVTGQRRGQTATRTGTAKRAGTARRAGAWKRAGITRRAEEISKRLGTATGVETPRREGRYDIRCRPLAYAAVEEKIGTSPEVQSCKQIMVLVLSDCTSCKASRGFRDQG